MVKLMASGIAASAISLTNSETRKSRGFPSTAADSLRVFPRTKRTLPACWGILKIILCLLISCEVTHAAVTLNQLETFSGIPDWTSGNPNPNPPVIQLDSGPLGAGDNALRVTSNGGSGAGGKLLVFNTTAWSGDYVGAGVLGLTLDLRNGGTTTLQVRLAFNGPGGWFVTPANPVLAFSGWNHLLFDVRPVSLVSAGGSSAANTMGGVTELRVLHSSAVDFKGAAVSSSFLLDNVQAVPEPGGVSLLALAGGLLARRPRKRFSP